MFNKRALGFNVSSEELFEFIKPCYIQNLERNNINPSIETRWHITAHDTDAKTITVDQPLPVELLEASTDINNRWLLTIAPATWAYISTVDFNTNTITYSSKSGTLSVGDHATWNNPYRSFTQDPVAQVINTTSWGSVFVNPGPVWKHSDGTYRMVSIGWNGTFQTSTLYSSADLKTWVLPSSTINWFLPSLDEFNLIYTNLYLQGVGGLASGTYWTSTESSSTEGIKVSTTTGVSSAEDKGSSMRIRPCSTFISSSVYALRDSGVGSGLIFHIVDNGDGTYTYYEAALVDATSWSWSSVVDVELTGTEAGVGHGVTNSALIMNQVDHTSSAAFICDVFVSTGAYKYKAGIHPFDESWCTGLVHHYLGGTAVKILDGIYKDNYLCGVGGLDSDLHYHTGMVIFDEDFHIVYMPTTELLIPGYNVDAADKSHNPCGVVYFNDKLYTVINYRDLTPDGIYTTLLCELDGPIDPVVVNTEVVVANRIPNTWMSLDAPNGPPFVYNDQLYILLTGENSSGSTIDTPLYGNYESGILYKKDNTWTIHKDSPLIMNPVEMASVYTGTTWCKDSMGITTVWLENDVLNVMAAMKTSANTYKIGRLYCNLS